MDGITLRVRPATAADMAFLYRVQEEAMRPHVERVFGPWDAEAQRARFAETTDPETHEIFEMRDEPVGTWWIRPHPDHLELVRIYLLAAAQGQGLGTHMMQRLLARAAAEGLPIRLRVLRGNPAERFYRRLGFATTRQTETHTYMECEPRTTESTG